MSKCKSCVFWTQHSIGDCSQKMQTQSGEFVNVRTVGEYGCTSYETDFKKYSISAGLNKDKEIYFSGIFDVNFLEKVIEKCNEHIKRLKRG